MADTFLIAANAIYKATHLVNLEEIGINVSKIQGFSPRNAFVKRYLVPGQNQVQALLTFDITSADALDPNLLQGVYLEISGEGVVIDCISIDNFIAAADGTGSIITRYSGGIPAFVSPSPTTYCVIRADDGTGSSHNKFVTDYVLQYSGSVRLRHNVSNVSYYEFSSYTVPIMIGSDTFTSGPCPS